MFDLNISAVAVRFGSLRAFVLVLAIAGSLSACGGGGGTAAAGGGQTTPTPTDPAPPVEETDPLPEPVGFNNVYYVNGSAADDSGTGSSSSPKKYIQSAIALMSANGNDAVVIAAGTYEHALDSISTVRNGQDGAYNVIKAAVDGTVVVRNLALPNSAAYVRFEGLKWDSATVKSIRGHHLKFMRCAFSGGPANGNTSTLSIGTNDADPGAHHILLEDVWAYGLGGRYNIIVFNSDKVVLRRVVVRHDGGWGGNGSDPEAGITVYNSTDTRVENAIVFDSTATYTQYWEAAFYHVKNASTTRAHAGTQIVGSMALNNLGGGFAYDDLGPIEATLTDSVAWGNGSGITLNDKGSGSPGHSVRASGVTIGATTGHGVAMYGGGPNTLDLRNSIVANVGGDLFRISNGSLAQVFNNCYSPTSSACAQALNPSTNGLLYLPRIETGSTLASAGEGGARIGAHLVNRVGVSGTLFGDTGFSDVTATSLWPWPNEARIRADMCIPALPVRGWCAGSASLTSYIWNYLGNGVPSF